MAVLNYFIPQTLKIKFYWIIIGNQSYACLQAIYLSGPVCQKPINANPRLKISQGVYFLHSQMLFSADIRHNFTLEEVILEKQK